MHVTPEVQAWLQSIVDGTLTNLHQRVREASSRATIAEDGSDLGLLDLALVSRGESPLVSWKHRTCMSCILDYHLHTTACFQNAPWVHRQATGPWFPGGSGSTPANCRFSQMEASSTPSSFCRVAGLSKITANTRMLKSKMQPPLSGTRDVNAECTLACHSFATPNLEHRFVTPYTAARAESSQPAREPQLEPGGGATSQPGMVS